MQSSQAPSKSLTIQVREPKHLHPPHSAAGYGPRLLHSSQQHHLPLKPQQVSFLMESKEFLGSPNKGNTEELPSLMIKNMTSKSVVDFDNVEHGDNLHNLCLNDNDSRGPNSLFDKEIKATTIEETLMTIPLQNSPVQSSGPHLSHSISLSMLASPSAMQTEGAKRVMFSNEIFTNGKTSISLDSYVNSQQQKLEFISQPPSVGNLERKMIDGKIPSSLNNQQRMLRNNGLRDKRFDSFKTWSGKIERQLSSLRGRPQEPEQGTIIPQNIGTEPLRVHRYFDALEGPELDTLKASEVSALPDDKPWPFLLRFPVSSFGICLGVSSQAILWKTLATSSSTRFLHITPFVNLVLWCISVALVGTVSSIYLLKIILYFEAFRREYYHPIRVNFFFAPWIAGLFLALGIPPSIAKNLHASLWYILMAPIFCLELKIYGQWMSGGQRRLSKVANPSNHLSIVGNFVGALLGATMGLKEGPIFFFSIGLAHYTVLFVTLYQRLPTNETLPKELHPVFFLFVAAPSVACTAWAKISGSFGYTSRIAYFIALFLYFSLAVRINFFRGFRFSLAWWAYTFPMTGASIATIAYSAEVNNPLTKTLSVALSAISTLTVTALLVSTILHAFVMQDLFPNDVSIAITQTKHKHLLTSSLDTKDTESSGFQKTIRHLFGV